jgi:hypothetical protein
LKTGPWPDSLKLTDRRIYSLPSLIPRGAHSQIFSYEASTSKVRFNYEALRVPQAPFTLAFSMKRAIHAEGVGAPCARGTSPWPSVRYRRYMRGRLPLRKTALLLSKARAKGAHGAVKLALPPSTKFRY